MMVNILNICEYFLTNFVWAIKGRVKGIRFFEFFLFYLKSGGDIVIRFPQKIDITSSSFSFRKIKRIVPFNLKKQKNVYPLQKTPSSVFSVKLNGTKKYVF